MSDRKAKTASQTEDTPAAEKEKKVRVKKDEGSRFLAIVILAITIVLSIGFYVYGKLSGSGLGFTNSKTWEFRAN